MLAPTYTKMSVYVVASGKGGVGKTMFTLNAGAALSALDVKTLIIDCDIAMANLAQVVNVNAKNDYTLQEVLAREVPIQDAIHHTSYGVDVVLSSVSIEKFLHADMAKLSEVLAEVVDRYEFIVLDTATGICQELLIPLSVCDEAILIVNPEFPSIVDAQKIRLIADNTGTPVKGVVINRVKGIKGELGAQSVADLFMLTVLGVIPEDKTMANAVTSKTPLVVKEPNSPAAKMIAAVVKKIAHKGEEIKEGEGEKRSRKKLFGRKK